MPKINLYFKRLKRTRYDMICPHCNVLVHPKDFERHCEASHNLHPKTQCVWCHGQTRWRNQKKIRFADHLLECSQRALFQYLSMPDIPIVEPPETDFHPSFESEPLPKSVFNSTPKCPEGSFFEVDYRLPHAMAYEPLSQPTTIEPPVTFQDPHLTWAASYVHQYVTNPDLDWYHIMVRAAAFESFVQSLENEEGGTTHILPFSCWCSGGTHKEPYYNHHRHMIAVSSPKNHFINNVWSKISTDEQPYPHYKCRYLKKLCIPYHLVHTIGYLCQRESKCNFAEKIQKKGKHHYYIFTSLPEDFRIALVLQWDGGIHNTIRSFCKNKYLHQIFVGNARLDGRRWKIQIKDIVNLPMNMVLPVSKHLWVTETPTEHYLHLADGEKVYFDSKKDVFYLECSEKDWIHAQAKHGNAFYRAAQHLWTEPAYFHQIAIQSLEHVKRVYELKRIEDAQKIQTLEQTQRVYELKRIEDAQKIQTLIQSIEDAQKIQSIEEELQKVIEELKCWKEELEQDVTLHGGEDIMS